MTYAEDEIKAEFQVAATGMLSAAVHAGIYRLRFDKKWEPSARLKLKESYQKAAIL